jgi:predicted nucleic acid-binding protein
VAFVLDASVSACWAFADETHLDAEWALELIRAEEAVVPALWWFEMRNILIVNERRGRITESGTTAFLSRISGLRVRVGGPPDDAAVLRLARLHRLTVYDAAYLELAQRQRLAIATLDAELRKAALLEGVTLVRQDMPKTKRAPRAARKPGGGARRSTP